MTRNECIRDCHDSLELERCCDVGYRNWKNFFWSDGANKANFAQVNVESLVNESLGWEDDLGADQEV